jgi:hypothetical protein
MKLTTGGNLRLGLAMAIALTVTAALAGEAQNCTTQSKMNGQVRGSLADAAFAFATEVKAGNATKLQSEAIAEFAGNFTSTVPLIADTSDKIKGDQLRVTQVYVLDARSRKSTDTGDADFSCPLAGTSSETDFSISGLPPGLYGFAMVEASGDRPWLISMLMRQDVGKWKLAGLYPHTRVVAGHDGLWFWNAARDDAKAKQVWFAWLMYGQADQLLRPSNFVGTTNLDKLRSEQRAATPPELADGISAENPLVLKSAAGVQARFSSVASEGSDDGKRLNLVMHILGDPAVTTPAAQMAANSAAASLLLSLHTELRQGFDGVVVISDVQGRPPFVTEQKIGEIH